MIGLPVETPAPTPRPFRAREWKRRQSPLMPAAFTALPQRSLSETRNSPYCFGVNTSGFASSAAKFALSAGSFSPALIAALSFSMMSGGVAFGAAKPYQPFAS